MDPYLVSCRLRTSAGVVSGVDLETTIVRDKACFHLDPNLCTLKKQDCH